MNGHRPNAVQLRETLVHIEANPDDWYQGDYRCGSGMCFAGWRAELSGGVWAFDASDFYAHCLVATPDDNPDHVRVFRGKTVIGAFDRAQRLLGLTTPQATRLFFPTNTLDDLRRIVSDLCSEVES